MSKKLENNTVLTIIIGLVILVISLLFASNGGGMEYQFDETSFTINAKSWKDLTVSYTDIESIELQDDVDPGRRTMGFGSAKFKFGSFSNSAFGNYTLYASTSCTKLVVLHMKDGFILALNDETDEATAALFAELNSRL